jgi:hypothetical protein
MEPFNLKTERTEGYFDETVRCALSFLFFNLTLWSTHLFRGSSIVCAMHQVCYECAL